MESDHGKEKKKVREFSLGEWIENDKISYIRRAMQNVDKCGTCKHFTNAGDYDLCCGISMRRLCYKDDDACEKWESNPVKHLYYVVRDGEVIQMLKDTEGIHPVYAISLMAQYLSERMQKEAEPEED